MYKLKDIISSGGTNPKINKAIDRYELSKDEKKDIINSIKNVQQGGEGNADGDVIKYIDPSKSQLAAGLLESAIFIKLQLEEGVIILPMSFYVANKDSYNVVGVLGASVDLDAEFVTTPGEQLTSVRKNLNSFGITDEQINSIPYITKEEFYNLQ